MRRNQSNVGYSLTTWIPLGLGYISNPLLTMNWQFQKLSFKYYTNKPLYEQCAYKPTDNLEPSSASDFRYMLQTMEVGYSFSNSLMIYIPEYVLVLQEMMAWSSIDLLWCIYETNCLLFTILYIIVYATD